MQPDLRGNEKFLLKAYFKSVNHRFFKAHFVRLSCSVRINLDDELLQVNSVEMRPYGELRISLEAAH